MSYSAIGYKLNANESTIKWIYKKNQGEKHQSEHKTTVECAKATSIIHDKAVEKIKVAKFEDSWDDDPFFKV